MKISGQSMLQKIVSNKQTQIWFEKYDQHAPKAGDPAPDFELSDVTGKTAVRLSDLIGEKPVALIFGGFTWKENADETVGLKDLFETFQSQVVFLSIFIRRTNPVNDWFPAKNLSIFLQKITNSIPKAVLEEPKNMADRRNAAAKCTRQQKYNCVTLVDEMDDRVNKAYAGYPARLYLIGLDGKVVYAGGMGPWEFYPQNLYDAIERYLNVKWLVIHDR